MIRNTVVLVLTVLILYAPGSQSSTFRGLTRLLESMQAAPVCLIENGFDYVGYDISNAPGTVDKCCDICSWTFGCKAWSWSDYNGGTCWLKSGRGDIAVNPNVKSALNPKVSSSYCQLNNDLDLIGNDIARVDSKTADGCCSICQNYPGCRAYAWSDYLGGSCWLKSKAGQSVYKVGVKSGKAYPDLTPSCSTLEVGIDYVDNDIGNQPGKTPEACCDICKATNHCRAFSWTNQNGGTCWLKNLKGNAVYKPGVTSSQVYPNPDPQCTLKQDTDYVDNDMGYVPSTDPLLCCSICRERSGCKAFAWSNFNGGTCWLKTAANVPMTKSGVLSATI